MRAWLTQDSIPSTRTEYVLTLPSSWEWRAQFLGAFLLLTKEENWQEFGTLTPQEMADEWLDLFLLFESEGVRLMPVGTIMGFAGATAPSGWLLCNGQAVSRVDYADLFALVDLTYGFGDGSTTFNVPDLRGRVAVGRDASDENFNFLGEFGGEADHTLLVGEMPVHNHTQNSHNHTQNSHNHNQDSHNHGTTDGQNFLTGIGSGGGSMASGAQAINGLAVTGGRVATNQAATATNQAATATNNDSGGGASHNNLQPYLTLNYIIKY